MDQHPGALTQGHEAREILMRENWRNLAARLNTTAATLEREARRQTWDECSAAKSLWKQAWHLKLLAKILTAIDTAARGRTLTTCKLCFRLAPPRRRHCDYCRPTGWVRKRDGRLEKRDACYRGARRLYEKVKAELIPLQNAYRFIHVIMEAQEMSGRPLLRGLPKCLLIPPIHTEIDLGQLIYTTLLVQEEKPLNTKELARSRTLPLKKRLDHSGFPTKPWGRRTKSYCLNERDAPKQRGLFKRKKHKRKRKNEAIGNRFISPKTLRWLSIATAWDVLIGEVLPEVSKAYQQTIVLYGHWDPNKRAHVRSQTTTSLADPAKRPSEFATWPAFAEELCKRLLNKYELSRHPLTIAWMLCIAERWLRVATENTVDGRSTSTKALIEISYKNMTKSPTLIAKHLEKEFNIYISRQYVSRTIQELRSEGKL
jgi:hypothetical protein